ncbi:MAG: YncE family protein, partial [Vicinamibacteria bacterium]
MEGEVFISPPPGSENWRYEVDLDEDGGIDQQGVLGLGVGFRYRFTTPGIHTIRTTLTGPEGRTVEVESLVVVNDRGPIRILAAAQIPPVDPEWVSFEGITMSHSGDALYVANYSGGSLHRVDPADLSVTGVIEEMSYSIEGISVSPGDSFLFAAYKYHHAASVELASFEIDRFFERGVGGKFFIQAIDEHHALIGGEGPLGLVDMRTGETVRQYRALGAEFTYTWHFALSPDGTTAAVIVYDDAYFLHIVDAATLQPLRTIPLGRMAYPRTLTFHPQGDRLYVLGYEEDEGALFVVFDLQSGETLREVPLGRSFCTGYCVASPVATLV